MSTLFWKEFVKFVDSDDFPNFAEFVNFICTSAIFCKVIFWKGFSELAICPETTHHCFELNSKFSNRKLLLSGHVETIIIATINHLRNIAETSIIVKKNPPYVPYLKSRVGNSFFSISWPNSSRFVKITRLKSLQIIRNYYFGAGCYDKTVSENDFSEKKDFLALDFRHATV